MARWKGSILRCPLMLLAICCCCCCLLLAVLVAAADLDYYKVLGVSKAASERDIKTAYRRQSKKWHPDKHEGDKDEASRRFVEISQAYEVLSDKEKRQVYDRFGHDGLRQREQQGQGGGFHNPFDIFTNMFHQQQQQQQVRRGPNMVMDMEVDLSDMYTGKTYEIQVERKTICEACSGSGARSEGDIQQCDTCGGHGVRIVKHMLAPGMFQQVQMQCDRCGGRGRTIKHLCTQCHGHRIVAMKSDISVDIDRGLAEGTELVFEGEADENPDWVAGDLIVRVRSRQPKAGFTRRNENLYWKEPISVAEALLGFQHTIHHFDGHTVKLSSTKGSTTQPGHVQILPGEGLPRLHSSDYGDLYVEYTVVLPSSLKASTYKKLQDAFDHRVPTATHEEL